MAALGAVRFADRGPEKAQVIVDFGDGADGGTGRAGGGFLLDGDGGREAVDRVDVGRLDVTPLAFGVDRVKGERAFARAGKAGDHGERVPRDGDVDVFQVVVAGATNRDVRHTHAIGGAPVRGMVHEAAMIRIRHARPELDRLVAQGWIRPICRV